MGNKGRFVKNSLLFLLGSGLSKALGIIMLPLYTSHIPTEDYGAYDISLTLITIVSSIAFFELWSAVLRFMYDFSKEDKKASVVKSGGILFIGSTALFIFLGIWLCAVLGLGHPGWLLAYGVAMSASNYFCFVARGYDKNREFTISGILSSVVIAATNVFFILYLGFDYSALYISYVLGCVAQCVYLAYQIGFIKVLCLGELERRLTRSLLAFAAPLCLNTASYWILSSASRLVFNWMCGDSASGVFSVGNKFGQVIVLATTCFTYAWQDLSFSEGSKGAQGGFYTRACKLYLLFLSASFAMLLPAVRLAFPLFVKGSYGDAMDIVPLALVVALVSGYSGFVGNVFYAIKKTKTITVSTIAAGLVAVALSPAMISAFGANGVNLSVLMGFLVNLLIRAIVLKKEIGFSMSAPTFFLCCGWIVASCTAYFAGNIVSLVAFVTSIAISAFLFRNEIADVAGKLLGRKLI